MINPEYKPRLVALYQAVQEERKVVSAAEGKAWEAEEALGEELAEAYKIDDSTELKVGHWECENSPIGVCFYDGLDDPCWDDCIVCHLPDERK